MVHHRIITPVWQIFSVLVSPEDGQGEDEVWISIPISWLNNDYL
jgi:hypothetical protein